MIEILFAVLLLLLILTVLLIDHIRHRNAKLETGKHTRKG